MSNKPKLRFKGFTNDWEQRKLGEISSEVRGNDGNISNIPVLTISASMGWMNQIDRFSQVIAGDELKKYTKLKRGELSYNHGNSKVAKFGAVFVQNNYDAALVPRVYHSFKVLESISPFFIEYLFATKFPDKELGKLVTSGARMDGLLNINRVDFFGIKINIPTFDEQFKISNLLQSLDSTITLHEEKLAQLKLFKKAMLQRMFADKSECPDVRFNGFTDAWEHRKLGELGKTKSGIGFPEKEQGGKTGIPFFKISDMTVDGNENIMVKSNNYVSINQIKNNNWKVIDSVPSVIFAKVGAALMLNRKRLVKTPFLIDNNTMSYYLGDHWDVNFGKALFDTLFLPKYAQVGALPSFNASDIENISVNLPDITEQQKIGLFLNQFDTLITLQQRKLDQLHQTKKFLLQNMFI